MSTDEPTPQPTGTAPALALARLSNGFRISQMLSVAAQLGLADLLVAGAHSSADLAERTGTHAPSLYRLLRALSSVGVFSEDDQGRFGLTPLAEPLRSDVPGSLRAWVAYCGSPQMWRAWGELAYSVRTGEPAFPEVFGMDIWAYRVQHPAANAIFNAAMTAHAAQDIPPILAAYDFSPWQTIVDVGGGNGILLAAILAAYPALRGILLDQPHVVAAAAARLQAAGVADRCQLVGGDFFAAAPRGGDGYLLRAILHDWDDGQCVAILRTCHQAMPAHAKLLIVEGLIQPANRPDPTKLVDINMLVMAGGQERTAEEFRALLARAGFALTQVIATTGDTSIIEAAKA